jgi:hypothetical protein
MPVYADSESTITSNLMGLGVSGQVASYIAEQITGGAVLNNDTYLKARNAANSADIDVLKVDATDNTIIKSSSVTGADILMQSNDDFIVETLAGTDALVIDTATGNVDFKKAGGLTSWSQTTDGHFAQDGTNGGLLIFNKANTTMRFNGVMGGSTKAPQTVAPDDWIEVNIAGTTYYIPVYAAS